MLNVENTALGRQSVSYSILADPLRTVRYRYGTRYVCRSPADMACASVPLSSPENSLPRLDLGLACVAATKAQQRAKKTTKNVSAPFCYVATKVTQKEVWSSLFEVIILKPLFRQQETPRSFNRHKHVGLCFCTDNVVEDVN